MRRRSSFSDVRRCVCANIRETSQASTNSEEWQGKGHSRCQRFKLSVQFGTGDANLVEWQGPKVFASSVSNSD